MNTFWSIKFLFFSFLFLVITGCKEDFKVVHFGELRKVMKQNDLSAHIDFKNHEDKEHLYALGALENLKGELIVLDGIPYQILADNDSVIIEEDFDFKAAFAVTVNVKKWKEFPVPKHIRSKKDLEEFVFEKANSEGLYVNKPFPFLLEGLISSITWHVVNWPEEDSEHTHEKHVKSGPNGTNIDEVITLLGFYSDQHHGVFTHHSTNLHMHFLRKDEQLGGHVDNLVLGGNMFLKLPA
jgi:acetolactate decarboxylase